MVTNVFTNYTAHASPPPLSSINCIIAAFYYFWLPCSCALYSHTFSAWYHPATLSKWTVNGCRFSPLTGSHFFVTSDVSKRTHITIASEPTSTCHISVSQKKTLFCQMCPFRLHTYLPVRYCLPKYLVFRTDIIPFFIFQISQASL